MLCLVCWSLLDHAETTTAASQLEARLQAALRDQFPENQNIEQSACLEVNTEKTKYMLLSRHQNAGQNHDIKIANRFFTLNFTVFNATFCTSVLH
jgi:site-specific DNA-adenine methylase